MNDWQAIVECQVRYTRACDQREWALLETVFTADATGDYGGWRLDGRDRFVHMLRLHLDHAGPTQHLVGSHTVEVTNDHAHAVCAVHAFHLGASDGQRAGESYTVIGLYHDDLIRTPDGWRIHHRRFVLDGEVGDRNVILGKP